MQVHFEAWVEKVFEEIDLNVFTSNTGKMAVCPLGVFDVEQWLVVR